MLRGARVGRGGRGGNRERRGQGLSRTASAASILSETVGAVNPADREFGYTSDGAAEFAGGGNRETPMRGRGQGNRVARGRTVNTRGMPDLLPIATDNIEHQLPQEARENGRQERFKMMDRAPVAFKRGPSPGPKDQIAAGAGAGQAPRGGAADRVRGRGGVQVRGAHAWGGATPRRNWYAQPMVFSPNIDDTSASAAVAKLRPDTQTNRLRSPGRAGAARRGDARAGADSTRRYAAQHVEESDEPVVPGTPVRLEGRPSASRECAAREPTITSPPTAEPNTHRRANTTRAWRGARQDLMSPATVAARDDDTQKEGRNAADEDAPPGAKRGTAHLGQDADGTDALGEQGVANDHAVNSVSAAGARASPPDSATVTTQQAGVGAKGHKEEGQEHTSSAYQTCASQMRDDLGPLVTSTLPDSTASSIIEEPAHDHADASEQDTVVPDLLVMKPAPFPLRWPDENARLVAGQVGTRRHVQHIHPKGRSGPFFQLTASSYRRQRVVDEQQDAVANERAAKKECKGDQTEGQENRRTLNVHPPFANVFIENLFRFLTILVVTATVILLCALFERNQRPR